MTIPLKYTYIPRHRPYIFIPEKLLSSPDDTNTEDRFLLFDPNTFYSEVSGFYRLEDGDKITLGGENNKECEFLNIPKKNVLRKLSITNDEGNLIFKSHISKPKSYINPVFSDKKMNKIVNARLSKLERLKSIVGNPAKLLSADKSLDLIKKINKIMQKEVYRPENKLGQPGGVIAFPKGTRVILIGDLHAKPDNLLVILTQNGILQALEDKQASVVILGDAVHPECEVQLDESGNLNANHGFNF